MSGGCTRDTHAPAALTPWSRWRRQVGLLVAQCQHPVLDPMHLAGHRIVYTASVVAPLAAAIHHSLRPRLQCVSVLGTGRRGLPHRHGRGFHQLGRRGAWSVLLARRDVRCSFAGSSKRKELTGRKLRRTGAGARRRAPQWLKLPFGPRPTFETELRHVTVIIICLATRRGFRFRFGGVRALGIA